MSQKERILLIPHAPATAIRTRTGELALALSSLGQAVDLFRRSAQDPGLSKGQKLRWHFKEACLPWFRYETVNEFLRNIYVPTLHFHTGMAGYWDEVVSFILMKMPYRLIFSAAYDGLPARKNLSQRKFIYDYVDDHASGWIAEGKLDVAARVESYVKRQMATADQVVASSLVLMNLAKNKYQRNAMVIPNGARVKSTRQQVFADGFVRTDAEPIFVGYIGGLDSFVRIDLVVKAIASIRNRGVDMRMSIVGWGPALDAVDRYDWLDLKGFRQPDEIPQLMREFSIGVVPFTLSSFTHAALPLKVIEYGAAQLMTISSPLEELKLRQFPWVHFADLTVDSWIDALTFMMEKKWSQEWDGIVDRFEWIESAKQLLEAME